MNLKEWETKSRKSQEGFSLSFSNRVWELYRLPQDKLQLWQKIATALYGEPKKDADDFGLVKDEKKNADAIRDKCIEYSRKRFDDVYIAIIFTCVYRAGKIDTIVPVIRVRWNRGETQDVSNSYFIDHVGRVYNTWSNYLKENVWDMCWICVPAGGIYPSDQSDCSRFYNQTSRGNVVEKIDTVSTIAGVTTSLGLLAGLALTVFPPTAPLGAAVVVANTIVGTPGAVYGAGRSIGKIADRIKHDQSVGLGDAEARMCWLNIVASLVSFAGLGATKALSYAGKMGIAVSGELRIVCTGLGIAAISTSGLGVLNYAVELNKKKEITPLDALQFTTSVFFLTHSVVTFKTASTIIKESQQKYINKMRRTEFKDHADVFDRYQRGMQEGYEPGRVRTMHGNTEFIKEIRRINNPKEFFSAFNVMPDGQFRINNELIIHPRSFCQMNQQERAQILKLSSDLKNNRINMETFNKNVQQFCQEHRISFENRRATFETNINKALDVDSFQEVTVNGKRIFENLKPHEIDRLNQVLKGSCTNYDDTKFGMELVKRQGCKNVTEFCAVVEYAIRQRNKMAQNMRAATPMVERPKNIKHVPYYRDKIVNDFNENPKKFDSLNESFNQQRIHCDEANAAGNPKFGNSMAAANHYDKHNVFPNIDANNNLSPEKYFAIAREMASGTVVNPKWTQDGSKLSCKFDCDKFGASCVRFDNLADGSTIIATLFANGKLQTNSLYKS